MNRIYSHLTENGSDVVYVCRGWVGSWSIHLKDKGNITGRGISGYEQLDDTDLDVIRSMGFKVFDYKDCNDPVRFYDMTKEMESSQ